MADRQSLIKLFEAGRIGRMDTRNRIVMPAMVTCSCTEDGYVTEQTTDYYKERAKGGVGLIIVESSCVDLPFGRHSPRPLAIDHDKFIPGLKNLSQIIQKYGAKAAIQLSHSGAALEHTFTGNQPAGPSAIVGPGGKIQKELTEREIGYIVYKFGEAAKRAQRAGFDGIEIHAAHAYLVAQFLSSAWNRRKDKYGGSLQNRARFLLEIINAVREMVGKSYPIWCRINGEEEGIENGTTLGEAQALARILQESCVDAINVSAAKANFTSSRPNYFSPGYITHLAAGIKDVVSVPVMTAGRISPDMGEQLLRDRKADYIVMGRALRADPELANKLASERLDDIRPCLACNACIEYFRPGGQRLCAANAEIGREREYKISKVGRSKKVLIAGGGPAGMETARIAALRGHIVTICEKDSRLGGKLLQAAISPHKSEIEAFKRFLVGQVEKLGVKIKLNTEVNRALLQNCKPDVLIIATGTIPVVPHIPGVKRKNVFTAEEFLSNQAIVGDRVIVLGGGTVGCEVAEVLAEMGKQVTIVEILEKLAHDMTVRQGRQNLLDILSAKGVTMLTQSKSEKISAEGMVITSASGRRQTIEADSVVLACGYAPSNKLLQGLNEKMYEIHIVGDCVKPRTILEAIDDGARVARAI